jgi:hypothetical protein
VDEGHFCDPLLGPAGGGTCGFDLRHLELTLRGMLTAGYTFLTCAEYADGRRPTEPFAVLRHDMDALPVRALALGRLEHRLGIRASYFVRVHANEYNAFGFDTVQVLRQLTAAGHEIGLHAEPRDLHAATGCDPDPVLVATRHLIEAVVGVPVRGVASHNDITPDNNLLHFSPGKARSLGFRYEAYDDDSLGLFATSTYVTDGHYWRWRAFVGGRLTDDESCLCQHAQARTPRLYVLLHPHVWYERHFHLVATGGLTPAAEPGGTP